MSSKQLGEMFEGDSADTCGGKFPLKSMGAERECRVRRHGSEDPNRLERKFWSERALCRRLAAANVVTTIFGIGPSVLRATSGLAEQLR